jgi:PIN domain nuclease of toxin-antitoxin system
VSVRLLLDTHALLWWWKAGSQLSDAAASAIAAPDNEVYVSAASAWEIATKVRKGQLPAFAAGLSAFAADLTRDGFRHLEVTVAHGLQSGSLGGDHKDPFDRLLAAQAMLEDLVIVTRDAQIAAFGCRTLW